MADKVVKVANISSLVTEPILRGLFGFLGEIRDLKLYNSQHDGLKECTIEFQTPAAATTALHLSGLELGDRLIVVTATTSIAPSGTTASQSASGGNQAPINPVLPLAHYDPAKAEEIARTVYIGNLSSSLPEEEIIRFFSNCGPVAYLKMSGDATQPTRFAFMEFATLEGARAAMEMTGTILADRPIKVNHSKNPISKPQPNFSSPAASEAMRRVREAQQRISNKIRSAGAGSVALGRIPDLGHDLHHGQEHRLDPEVETMTDEGSTNQEEDAGVGLAPLIVIVLHAEDHVLEIEVQAMNGTEIALATDVIGREIVIETGVKKRIEARIRREIGREIERKIEREIVIETEVKRQTEARIRIGIERKTEREIVKEIVRETVTEQEVKKQIEAGKKKGIGIAKSDIETGIRNPSMAKTMIEGDGSSGIVEYYNINCKEIVIMLILLLLFFHSLFPSSLGYVVPTQEQENFSGHQVVSVTVRSQEELGLLSQIISQNHLDPWTELKLGTVDVRIPPNLNHKVLFDPLPTPQVKIADVQQLINQQQNRIAAAGKSMRASFFDHFPTYAETIKFLHEMHEKYPHMTELINIGKTYEGKDMIGIRMWGRNGLRRRFVLHGGQHAREWITVSTVNYIIHSLLSQHNKDDNSTSLLDLFEVTAIPVMNVDGYIYTHTHNRLWRKNRQPNENSKCDGVDLNRNWGEFFGGEGSSEDPCDETYRGPKEFSAPETKAMANFLKSKEFVSYIDVHSYSQLWMWPYGGRCKKVPPNNSKLTEAAKAGVNALKKVHGTSYKMGPVCTTIYPASGSAVDWAYEVADIPYSYSIELRDTGHYGFLAPPEEIVPTGEETLAGIEAMLEEIIDQIHKSKGSGKAEDPMDDEDEGDAGIVVDIEDEIEDEVEDVVEDVVDDGGGMGEESEEDIREQ
ncbi:uncharacterized protein VTP21DRAFT_931 [Calcarisporiella thermophila]|uniref:uncharacterized protein n=1 Tax=Calcarisporiella thermophila TaxID=911321 RepID=UPI0037448B7F